MKYRDRATVMPLRHVRPMAIASMFCAFTGGCAPLDDDLSGGDQPSIESHELAEEIADYADVGWAYADQLSGTYTPNGWYSHNTKDVTNKVTQTATGAYDVSFPKLGGPGGNVQVTAYGSGNARCQIKGWSWAAGNETVSVRCHTPSGTPINSRFTVSFFRGTGAGPLEGAYLFADLPSTTSTYYASPEYSWNSRGHSNTVTRQAAGVYRVRLPGMFSLQGTLGNVIVTAVGTGAQHCKTAAWWPASSTDVEAEVRCFAANGSAADARFSLSYAPRDVPAPFGSGAFVWANEPSTSSYVPDERYAYDRLRDSLAGLAPQFDQPIQAKRVQTGRYELIYPAIESERGTMENVTAYGRDASYCKVAYWLKGTDERLHATVLCFNSAGSPVDTMFLHRHLVRDIYFL